MNTPAPSPQLFFETVNAYHRTAVLKAAIELDLFSRLAAGPATAAELSAACGCPERGVRILLQNLVVIGFLLKQEERFALTPDSAVFLVRSSPAYLGDSIRFLLDPSLTGAFADLAATVRAGRLHTTPHGTTAPDHPVWVEFARTMSPMMVPAAEGVAGLVTLPGDRETRILDVSSSHGAFGIALARRHPRAHLVGLDWEAVLAVTEENARAAGIGDRFSKLVGDAFTTELGSGYDVALVPNFLHHFNVADCTRFLRRIRAALRPGGRVVIVEFVPNEDRVSPPAAASFSLVMLGTTPEGDAYTFRELSGVLAEAGFREATRHDLPPTAQSAVIGTV